MSRVGKLPIAIPSGVTITIDPAEITIAGSKGTLKQFTMPDITVKQEGEEIIVSRANDEPKIRAKHGLMRALLNNMVQGVSQGGDAAMVELATTVECDSLNFSSLGLLGDFLTDPGGFFGHGAFDGFLADSCGVAECLVGGVVDQLGSDVQVADKNAQTWTLGCTAND